MSRDREARRARQVGFALLADLRQVGAMLGLTVDPQWERGRRPSRSEDVPLRGKGEPSDAVADTALDDRRLGLRHARKSALRRLDRAASELRGARAELERAMAKWEGL